MPGPCASPGAGRPRREAAQEGRRAVLAPDWLSPAASLGAVWKVLDLSGPRSPSVRRGVSVAPLGMAGSVGEHRPWAQGPHGPLGTCPACPSASTSRLPSPPRGHHPGSLSPASASPARPGRLLGTGEGVGLSLHSGLGPGFRATPAPRLPCASHPVTVPSRWPLTGTQGARRPGQGVSGAGSQG